MEQEKQPDHEIFKPANRRDGKMVVMPPQNKAIWGSANKGIKGSKKPKGRK